MKPWVIGVGAGAVALVGTVFVVMAESGSEYEQAPSAAPAASEAERGNVARGSMPAASASEPRVARRAESPRSERADQRDGERRRRGWGGFERPDNWDEMSRDERREYMRGIWQKRRATMLARFDADGDGELNDEERRAMRTAALRSRMENVWGGEVPLDDEELREAMRLTRRDMRQRFSELREVADEDGDGELTQDERELAREIAGDMFRRMGDEFVADYDSDRSGALSESERAVAAESIRHELRVLDAYRAIDANGDGRVEQHEVADHSARLSSGDRSADLNGDGRITPADTDLLLEAAQQEPLAEPPQRDGPRRRGGGRGGQETDQPRDGRTPRDSSDGSGSDRRGDG